MGKLLPFIRPEKVDDNPLQINILGDMLQEIIQLQLDFDTAIDANHCTTPEVYDEINKEKL